MITGGDALAVWVADLLQKCPISDSDQRWFIVEELLPNFRKLGSTLLEKLDSPDLPSYQLGFGDRSSVVVSGEERILDLATAKWYPGKNRVFFERVLYDLTVLFCRRYRDCQQQAEQNNRDEISDQ